MNTINLSDKLTEIANKIVGKTSTTCFHSPIDFIINIGTSETFYEPEYKEEHLIDEWKDLVKSYLTTCKYMFPDNISFKICWGAKPDIICTDGTNYNLYSSFIIVPEDGRQISKRVLFCPHCSKPYELDSSFQEKKAAPLVQYS